MQAIVSRLDHRMLLPTRHPRIKVQAGDDDVEVRYDERRWMFPAEDCILLPIEQTTAELLAKWVGLELLDALGEDARRLTQLRVEVEENFGQWALWETDPSVVE